MKKNRQQSHFTTQNVPITTFLLIFMILIRIAAMKDSLTTKWFTFNKQDEFPGINGEHLNDDNPFAYSVAEPVFKNGVIVFGLLCRKGYCTDPHTVNYHDLRFILQGSLEVTHGGKTLVAGPGDVAYTPPEMEHQYRCNPDEIPLFIYVKIEDHPPWEPLKKGGPFIEPYEPTAMMFLLLRRILDAYRSREIRSIIEAKGDSHAFLRFLRLLINRKKVESQRIQNLRELVGEISREPGHPWTQNDMSKRLHTSSRHLLRMFKTSYGCSPMEMVLQQRLNRAMELLANTDDSIEEVSRSCGYENVSSFIRVFRKRIGNTPGQYRKDSLPKKEILI